MIARHPLTSRGSRLASVSFRGWLAGMVVLVCCSANTFGDNRAKKSGAKLTESEVSFTVHNPGIPGEATIHGTLIQPLHPKDRTGTAVLLLHGAISDRTSWMGPIDGVPSMAHQIAQRGHSVFAIDRLGYGASVYNPFPAAGWAITTNTEVETIHEVVAQIREAACQSKDGSGRARSVASSGARRVVLVGISLGGGLAQLYATRYHDTDGIVSLAWSNQHAGETISIIFNQFVIPQFVLGIDHVYFFPPSDGFSEECAWMFYAPGIDPDVLMTSCTDGFFGTSPSGELTTSFDMTAETMANLENVTTPALLVYGEFDNFFPGPGYSGLLGHDIDTVTPDVEMWKSRSHADVDVLMVQDTGHAIPFHESANKVTKKIIQWIDKL